uniref:mannosyl-oligosaccharide 1,3-1,6-alpha-mannosidase n=1 Tax=Callorhinchus milii TaxID=7868 RepID=A0A4W3JJA1_CALMI
MKLSKQFTVFGSAIFCVVIFSLYLMLDHVQFDHPKATRKGGGGLFPKGQLLILHEKIDHLERLLAENNEIISNIRDSVINLSESVKDGRGSPEATNVSKDSFADLFERSSLVIPIEADDCQFASKSFTKRDINMTTTQHILNNMVVKLQEDIRRRFMWTEISYFSKWWDSIDSQKKDAVKRLCQLGQFEITTGGWVMPDEASTHYFAMIDQLLEGHQWLERNLGVKPRAGWAIDPFGHTSTMAYILKKTGFSNMLIQRVHYSVKKYFATQRKLEFFWRQNWDQNGSTDILCHMMPFYSYDVPHTCGPDPKICCQFDFKRLPGGRIHCPWRIPPVAIHDDNIQERAQLLLDQYRKKSKLFSTKVVLVPLGDDFRYDKSSEWDQQFLNYQKLFDYMNSHPELHVKAQFGTLSDYFDALNKAAGSSMSPSPFPIVSGDFFTYADRDDHYWSGYFTSRPFYKRLDRVLESHLRAAEILYSLALVGVQKSNKMTIFPSSENYKLLVEARRNLGLFQHHDGITGTSKEWVVVDYGTRFLVMYNPTDQDRTSVVTVYVNSYKVRVQTASGQHVTSQVSAVWDTPTTVSKDAFQVSFLAQVPALGLGLYQLVEAQDIKTVLADYTVCLNGREDVTVSTDSAFILNVLKSSTDDLIIENSNMKAWFSGTKGFIQKIKTKDDDKEHQINIQFMWYGTTSNRDKSGAYLFLPDGEAKPYFSSKPPILRITRGPIFSEIVCIYEHFTHSVRLNNVQGIDGLSMEVSNIVDITREQNREMVMRLVTDINSQNQFYTDLNDFQIQPRQTLSKLPLQANFYPLTTTAYIQDNGFRLTLHSAQSLGVASLKSGQLEIIMDRRLMQDDNRGLGQGLQDNKVTANLFRLLLERKIGVDAEESKTVVNYQSLLSHITSSYLNHPIIPMPVNMNDDGIPPLSDFFSPLTSSMPCDMHLLNLRTIGGTEEGIPSDETALIIHRKGFDCRFSNKNTGLLCSTTRGKIPVFKLFKNVKIQSLIPSSLTLMHTLPEPSNTSEIHLNPMEISTFRIRLR